jgi:hypothetical protein
MSSSALYGTGTYVSTVNGDGPPFFTDSTRAAAPTRRIRAATDAPAATWCVDYQVSGQPLPGTPGSAWRPTQHVVHALAAAAEQPTTYSYEIWFRTTTSTGAPGAFEIEKTGESAQYDRHLYMQNDGRLTSGSGSGRRSR